MSHELEFIEHFRKVPVFSLSDVNQIVKNRAYSKKFIKRMAEGGKVFRIKRGLYTLYKDPLLVATFIKMPSYITGVSALSFHRAISQIPKDFFCFTLKQSSSLEFNGKLKYFKTRNFFGYNMEDYRNFKIPIADNEKAIIDSIGIIPLHVVEEAFEEIDENRMLSYLRKINKSEIVKRVGFLMERRGLEVYDKLKGHINYKYILLDPLGNKKGSRNKKWRLIINI